MLNSKRFKLWISIFILLLLVVFVVLMPQKRKSERNFKQQLVQIPVETIDKIVFQLPDSDVPMSLVRNQSQPGWQVVKNEKSYQADTNMVHNLLHSCVNMPSVRMAGSDKSTWAKFHVADTNAIILDFFSGKKKLKRLYVGNFNYMSQQSQNAGAVNNQGRITTFVREEGDKATYAVDGYLKANFSNDLPYYRNKVLFKADKTKITRVYTQFADGSSYELVRQNAGFFTIDGQPADSLAVNKFFHSADNVNSRDLVDDIDPSSLPEKFDLVRFEGENMTPVTLKAYKADEDRNYIITSSVNPNSYFSDPIERIYRMVFKPRSFYLPEE